MKALISYFLWIIGLVFFAISFIILFFCLMTLSREKTYVVARRLFKILIRLMGIKLVIKGLENIDQNNTYLIMGNHQSLFDVFVIPCAIPFCIVGVEASYHFDFPLWGYMIKKWGNIPIERKNRAKAILSLNKAKESMDSGLSMGILPEGHRTLTGKIGPFKKGPFYLAKNSNADILPFGIKGLFEYNKKGTFLLKPGIVEVQIGKPIYYKDYKTLSVDELKDNVRGVIIDLAGQK